MEQMQKRYSMDRDELLRNIAGMESGLVNIDTSGGEGLPFDRVSLLIPCTCSCITDMCSTDANDL